MAPGECRALGAASLVPDRPGAEGDEALLELLDAGALWVVLPQQSTLVRPTLYPDVLPHVSGVHYRMTISTEDISLRQVGIQGFGGVDVGTFEWLRREGPGEVRIQEIAGLPPAETPFAVRAASPLELRWSQVAGDMEVRVRMFWRVRPGARSEGVECRPLQPDWHVFAPQELAKVRSGPSGRDVTIQVLASYREDASLPDGMPATFKLSQSDSVVLTVTP
ncbi:MAG: hypothetical protein RBU30_23755 [Polyangia bacterium]|nr:hypothetical protein [Polyangia bacterium]